MITDVADQLTSRLNDDNPWPGLLSFSEADGKYFRGRDFETEMLYRRLERERLTILFGPSGLGKSSILQAGLFPLLRRENFLPVYIRLDYSPDKPDLVAQVKTAIVTEAERVSAEAPTPTAKETLWEYLHRKDADFWSRRHRLMIPVLVFDQFEEVFTLGRRDRSRAQATNAFILELADIVEGRPPLKLRTRLEMEAPGKEPSEASKFDFERHRYKILITLREDFLPDLEGLSPQMGSIGRNRFRLERLNGVAALQAVNQAPKLISPQVAERVVRFVAAADPSDDLVDLEVEPALLSVVCGELNSQRLERREAQITERAVEGSHNKILADFYERSIADLSEPVCAFVEEKLLTRHGFRNLVVYDEAVATPDVSAEDIETLVRRRLVRIEERGRRRLLELSHDLLTGVVTASRDERQRRLKEAQAVRKLEEQHRKKLRRTAILFLVFLLAVGALGGLGWAYLAQRQANELAAAIEAAEEAAEEASHQRAIAETRQREAERQRLEAEKARELAEVAAAEASRQQRIADAQREEAVRQRQEALRARLEAVEAFEDALVQRNLAESQRSLAEQRQVEVEASRRQVQQTNDALLEALRERLSSSDPGEVLGALDILLRGSQDLEGVLPRIDARWFASAQQFVPLLLALDDLALGRQSERWEAPRAMLVARFAEANGLPPPPTMESVQRVKLEGGEIAGERLDAALSGGDGGRATGRVRVSPFYLQQHEVTNAEYRRFDPSHAPGAPDDHPAVNVSWYDAMVYAAWVGGTLPTEAQWEFAARGTSGRTYPWGDEAPTRTRANFDDGAGRSRPALTPVGSFPGGATPEHIQDLAGNAWEWCRDGASPAEAAAHPQNIVLVDPLGSTATSVRVLKGGSYFNDASYLTATGRNFLHPEGTEALVGFRVAWPDRRAMPDGSDRSDRPPARP